MSICPECGALYGFGVNCAACVRARGPKWEPLVEWEYELLHHITRVEAEPAAVVEDPEQEVTRLRSQVKSHFPNLIKGPSVVVEISLDAETTPWDVAKLLMQAIRQITRLEDADFYKDFPIAFGRLFDKQDPEADDATAVGYWEIRD